jgi:hypothetical protein
MRFRLIATYLGAPYQAALGPGGAEITLFAACPPPEELGFSSAAGHWRKLVGIDELDGLKQARPAGSYRGARCLVLDDQGERLHITYLGEDPEEARQLGYWEIDREVFEMVVPRTDVTDLAEDQVEIAAAMATYPPAAPVLTLAAPVALDYDELALQYDEPAGHDVVPETNGQRPLDRVAAWHGSPEPWPSFEPPESHHSSGNGNGHSPRATGRTGRRDRIPIQAVFAELLDLAAIPQTAYAVDDEVPGAMCLVKTDDGFEVFASSDEARHEVRFFEDEEAAYFYLFGVLAAEAVRNGWLGPVPSTYSESNLKTLRSTNGSEFRTIPRPVRLWFLIAGGADGPPLPKQPRRPYSLNDSAYHK